MQKDKYVKVYSVPLTGIFILRFFSGNRSRVYFNRIKQLGVWCLLLGRIAFINDRGLKELLLNSEQRVHECDATEV